MRSHWTKLAAALCVAAILGVLTFSPFQQVAGVAYALEQTLEANLGLRYIHVRTEPAGTGFSEAWAELGEDGQLLRLRMIFPKTEDGAKEVVWQEGEAEVWFKSKGHVMVVREEQMAKSFPQMAATFDPKVATEQLHEAQAKGKVEIETREPASEGEPITLVVKSKDSPERETIYQVDSQTKLVEKIERYRLAGEKRELLARVEYLEYNQEVPADAFVMDVPADVMRIDMQNAGLSKGDMTDDQIAVKVAREFFEALIAKDYGRAGGIYSGMPAARMEEMFGRFEFLRIVSVGDALPHPEPRTKFLQVPCEVEMRLNGQAQIKEFMPNIRAVHNQPDRWVIGGGIRLGLTPEGAGLPQGDQTDDQIAVKVAREFFKALIAKDYERAGGIYSGIPASRLEKALGKIEFLRIVSVGNPIPGRGGPSKLLQVPCEVECREDGKTDLKEFNLGVQAVESQPVRWVLRGGF